jgi:hypothetical protein
MNRSFFAFALAVLTATTIAALAAVRRPSPADNFRGYLIPDKTVSLAMIGETSGHHGSLNVKIVERPKGDWVLVRFLEREWAKDGTYKMIPSNLIMWINLQRVVALPIKLSFELSRGETLSELSDSGLKGAIEVRAASACQQIGAIKKSCHPADQQLATSGRMLS